MTSSVTERTNGTKKRLSSETGAWRKSLRVRLSVCALSSASLKVVFGGQSDNRVTTAPAKVRMVGMARISNLPAISLLLSTLTLQF